MKYIAALLVACTFFTNAAFAGSAPRGTGTNWPGYCESNTAIYSTGGWGSYCYGWHMNNNGSTFTWLMGNAYWCEVPWPVPTYRWVCI
jgi:hypothetical protein